MLSLTAWDEGADAAVADFVARHPEGLVYYGPAFRRLLLDMLGCRCRCVLAWQGDDLVGVLPLMACEGKFGEVLNSLPFFGSYGGALVANGEAETALREAYERQVAQDAIAAATWISRPFASGHAPAHDSRDERIAQWTDLIELDASTGLPAAIESSARRNLRKAEEAGILVRETPDALPVLETMHRANMQAIGGRQKPPQFFRSVADVLEFGRDWTLYTAELHGRTVGALLLFQGGRTIEYIMPAIDDAARQLQPTALMIARAMRDAIERGFRRWNWGGTWLTQDGVYRFKRKWGARERRYSYFITIRDERLLACSPDELSAAYPYFYTAPYRLLAEHA